MLEFILHLEPVYLYPTIFLGHIFLGGLILIPALYLSITGNLSLTILLLTVIASSMVTDSIWYAIGKNLRRDRVYSFAFIRKRAEEAAKFENFYDKHGIWTVFLTKFVYGTRIASHLLAGIHKISFTGFIMATATGTTLWFFVLFFLVKVLNIGVSGAESVASRLQIIFLVGTAFILFFNWYSRKYIRKRLMNQKDKE